MPKYDVALIVTIDAVDYETALQEAEYIATGLGIMDEENASAVFDYERDNEGQRVLYLHDPNVPCLCEDESLNPNCPYHGNLPYYGNL